jgi:hypothetical protein
VTFDAVAAATGVHWGPLVGAVVALGLLAFAACLVGVLVLTCAFRLLNRLVPWDRLPPMLGAVNHDASRSELRDENLTDIPGADMPPLERSPQVASTGATGGSFDALDDREVERANERLSDILYSSATMHAGAITLRDDPDALRRFTRTDGKTVLDIAAIDILRDRERGVPRYNELRRQCHMPAIERFSELCEDPELAQVLERIYRGDMEKVDLIVGLHAE